MKLHIITGIAALAALVVSCGNPKSDSNSQETQATQEVQKKDFPKVYDDSADPAVQIDQAIAAAQAEGKFVIAQVGGNWCIIVEFPAETIEKDCRRRFLHSALCIMNSAFAVSNCSINSQFIHIIPYKTDL